MLTPSSFQIGFGLIVWTTTRVPGFSGVAHDAVPAVGELRLGPAEERLRVVRREVHAAVALRVAEVVVPEGAVERVAAVEVHDPRHVLDRVRAVARDVAVHRRRDVLLADAERAAAACGDPSPCRLSSMRPVETSGREDGLSPS